MSGIEDQQLLDIFLDEFVETVDNLEESFVEYERDPDDISNIQNIFRIFHNLKGASKTVGFDSLADFAHNAESILGKYKDAVEKPSPTLMQLLFDSVDALRDYSSGLMSGSGNPGPIENLTRELISADSGGGGSQDPSEELSRDIEANKDMLSSGNDADSVVEEAIGDGKPVGGLHFFDEAENPKSPVSTSSKKEEQPAPSPAKTPTQVAAKSAAPKSVATAPEETIKVATSKITEILDLFGEQVILLSGMQYLLDLDEEEVDLEKLRHSTSMLTKISRDIQHTMITLRMVSLRPLFNRLSRTIRDVGKMTNKDIDFVRVGESSELDKNIADALVDPLNHMVRNSVDHGLESGDEREAAGKSRTGRICLTAQRSGGSFLVILEDDGKGLNKEAILEKARSNGLIKPGDEKKLEDKDIFAMIFQSGFSTRKVADEISGRGVGMDVVNQTVKKLKGTILVESTPGQGSRFTIQLPLSLAMFNGTVIEVGQERYVIPNTDYKEIISGEQLEHRQVDQGYNICKIKDEIYVHVELEKELKVNTVKHGIKNEKSKNTGSTDDDKHLMIISSYADKKFAFTINGIQNQEQIVLKEISNMSKKCVEAGGGTILGDGQVAVVLDISSIMRRTLGIKDE